ncbi:MAG: YbaB/EbfC family nucleoid-associated protein [Lachnospiraceae bacterium]|nr:YbaB/EbfC family nucleoid-associated protein [Lachnospiraceae bacterium]
MAKKGGFQGGMPGNMNNLMKQAQRMQRQMEEKQKELETAEFEAQSGGGAVKVKVNGQREVLKVTLDPEAVDPDDVEMLEDLIMVAVNDALGQVDSASQDAFSGLTGGLGGGMGGLGGLF